MKTIGITHSSDLDGKCCRAILEKEVPGIICYPMDHGDPFPWNIIDRDTTLYMCDFSLSMPEMYRIFNRVSKFIWLDHHVGAIDKYMEFRREIYRDTGIMINFFGSRFNGKAACELTWEYFHPNEPVPPFIELLGAYDTWRQNDPKYSWSDEILPFQYGLLSHNVDGKFVWNTLFNCPGNLTNELICEEGFPIILYLKGRNFDNARRNSYEVIFEDLPALCINSDSHSSSILESLWDPQKYDLMIVYTYQKDNIYVSLYTTKDDVNCSMLAQKFGGNGHQKAAGFNLKLSQKIPWEAI